MHACIYAALHYVRVDVLTAMKAMLAKPTYPFEDAGHVDEPLP